MEDFEVALKLDSKHVNAKKYMCETLLAHAQMYVLCFKLFIIHVFSRLRYRCKKSQLCVGERTGACLVKGGMRDEGGMHGKGGVCGKGGMRGEGGMHGKGWQGDMHGGGDACKRDGYCSGRYASYWNAFLFDITFVEHSKSCEL